MSKSNPHVSDPEMLMLLDGELSPLRSAQIRAHVEACWNCRARMAEMEGTIIDFARDYRKLQMGALPPSAGPRALLSARLAELASISGRTSWHWPIRFAWAMRAATLGVALCGVTVVLNIARQHQLLKQEYADRSSLRLGVLPNTRLTPGASRPANIDELCSSAHEEVVGQVTEPLRNQVLAEYKIASTRSGEYEIDYLIAPGLGGTEDLRNLWPQPYAARTWNAYAKDALEERLHQLVCGNQLDLAVAQRDISSDWITAYKKYFQTEAPLSWTADISALSPQGR